VLEISPYVIVNWDSLKNGPFLMLIDIRCARQEFLFANTRAKRHKRFEIEQVVTSTLPIQLSNRQWHLAVHRPLFGRNQVRRITGWKWRTHRTPKTSQTEEMLLACVLSLTK
jgi:hypothetical protein